MAELDEGFEEVALDKDFQEVTSDSQLDEGFEEVKPERTLSSEAQSQATPLQEDISKSRSAAIGAVQGASFGFGEELMSPFIAAAGMSDAPTLPDESTWEKYKRLVGLSIDAGREIQKAAQEQNPGSYLAGSVAGGLAVPMGALGQVAKATKTIANPIVKTAAKVAAGSAIGAGTGGLAGLGEGEGTLEERLPEAAEGAQMGALVGGAIPLAGAAVKGTGELLSKIGKSPVVEDISKAFSRGVKGESLVTKTGRKEAADIVRESSGNLFDDIKSLQKQVGQKIQNEISQAQESGQKIDLSEEVDEVLNKLNKIKAEGSQEAAAYATSVEKEIKKILGIKVDGDEFMGVQSKDLPEGLILPKKQPVDLTQVNPDKAQDLKQVLADYTPKKGMAPQQLEPARVAGELRSVSSIKLSDLTERLPELNEQYSAIKDSLKRLGIKETKLPSQIQEKINNIVTKLESQNTTGDNARQLIEDVLENIKKVNPEMATKHQAIFSDIVERLNLSNKIIKGGESFSLTGTPKAAAMGLANISGLTAKKTGIAATTKLATNFTKALLDSKPVQKATTMAPATVTSGTLNKEPYELKRQVAQAAETADPELLNSQAEQIRQKYGNQGEQLATILSNMANKDKDARRALMFTILQNSAYRKMLGLQDEQD